MKEFKIKECNGQVLIIVTLSLTVLIGLVGLAIDSGRAYGVKAKLNAAVDAAAFAVINNLTGGSAEAERYFDANFPVGYMGSTTAGLYQVDINTVAQDGGVVVDVYGQALMPTIIMRIFGKNNVTVRAHAQITRKAVDIAFVVDNTTSLKISPDVTDEVITSAKFFVTKFNENMDRMALIKYAFGAEVPVGIETVDREFDKDAINTAIDNFNFGSFSNPNYTNSSEGFWAALNEHRLVPVENRPDLRVIVFFTDGAPNTFASQLKFKDGTTHTGSIRSNDNGGPSSTEPRGLWTYYDINEEADSPYYYGGNIYDELHATEAFPVFYNTHGDTGDNFPVITDLPREVTQYTPTGDEDDDRDQLYEKVNRVSRNLLESMAAKAREEGIYVFTLGLGSRLLSGTGPDNEIGEDLLISMANLDDADGTGIKGEYCYAGADSTSSAEENLFRCYDRLASAIIRLTK